MTTHAHTAHPTADGSDPAIADLRKKKGFICDMDGVIYHGNKLLPGVREFVEWLIASKKHFLFLTNSSERTKLELKQKLERMGLEVGEDHFYTSALATAKFLSQQAPNCTVYAIGDAGLTNALYEAGITMNDVNPDYVVVGETRNYNYESIQRAVRFVTNGSKLVATNPDITAPGEDGITPACAALVAPIALCTGKEAYYIGKPNALMMRTGLKILNVHSGEAVMIGDRMDTDVVAGIESGMTTVLVLSGISTRATIKQFAYRPTYILNGVGDIPPAK